MKNADPVPESLPHADAPSSSRRGLFRLAAGALLLTALPGHRTAVAAATSPGGTGTTHGAWAGGGTRRIGQAARFPDPFADSFESACRLICSTTIGPCHTASPERVDISDGWDGIPLRMALRVVDEACRPVPDAIVEIWHTNYTGGYSGNIMRMCNNDPDDRDRQFFRGYQRTDARGVVAFDTCYPGWYGGRAVHVHVRVQFGDYQADGRAPSSVVTQLLFSDELNGRIFEEHALYRRFGQPDTTLDTDGVVGGEADKTPYLFEVSRMDDGVMFAHKTLVVRQSMDDPLCRVTGARRGGRGPRVGPGGPPPEGGHRMPPPDGRLSAGAE